MPVELKILMTDDGKVNVGGPLQNKMLCYGLLELAKDVIRQWEAQNQQLVVPAAALPGDPFGRN